ncbi:unnamed protein product [Rotaria magnacalcarata]|uniref:Uncharacterized protein n=1 Tax=Rotaria magnacalcarata TaxID=392030 RepID=A0A819F4E7_9BILA|nr:unnamed protein product [Rotaria magnacalcarata]CAF1422075.1 unnamed protein product [Rotaria magnacalcarata]CAF1959036.1 unnamed protein product [Rotaria magnacalcarata]CAF2068754.1 unnamed protein product [Rotaria magnacalcarata]CAF2133093.1 unnamed protein product [Rotaria magnacalcarata]
MTDTRFLYKSLVDEDFQLFNKHKNSIDREVRKTFPSIPADFELKPVLVRNLEACGTIHNFKIALPDNKFAKISFLTGGFVMRPPGQTGPYEPPEPRISVDEALTSTADAD